MDSWVDKDLERPVPHPQGDDWSARRIFETLSHRGSHHAGQIAVLRYFLGETGVPPPRSADDVRQYCTELLSW